MRSASEPVASWPSTWIDPALGGITVESSRMSVVLPAPFGPSSPVTPWPIDRSSGCRAVVAP